MIPWNAAFIANDFSTAKKSAFIQAALQVGLSLKNVTCPQIAGRAAGSGAGRDRARTLHVLVSVLSGLVLGCLLAICIILLCRRVSCMLSLFVLEISSFCAPGTGQHILVTYTLLRIGTAACMFRLWAGATSG